MKNLLKPITNQKGINTIEVVLILTVLIGLALIFKNAVVDFIKDIIESFIGDSKGLFNPQTMKIFKIK